MAWIYFQELVESDLPYPNGSELSAIVRPTDTHKVFCCPGCNRTILTERLYGMTCDPSVGKCYQLSMLSLGDFLARIYLLQEMVRAWQVSEVDYSTKLSDSQKKFDRALSSWKMSQPLELEDWNKLSKSLPKWGMTVGGRCFLPQMLEPLIKGKDGSYLPTLVAANYGSNQGGSSTEGKIQPSLETMARKNLWPTPTVHGNNQNKGNMIGLGTAVRRWPSPCARDWKDSPNQKHRGHGSRDDSKLPIQVYLTDNSGHLNPAWVEWLMGYRTGWTELSASATLWFRTKSKEHSRC